MTRHHCWPFWGYLECTGSSSIEETPCCLRPGIVRLKGVVSRVRSASAGLHGYEPAVGHKHLPEKENCTVNDLNYQMKQLLYWNRQDTRPALAPICCGQTPSVTPHLWTLVSLSVFFTVDE